jgi:multidrug resistance efflux pump
VIRFHCKRRCGRRGPDPCAAQLAQGQANLAGAQATALGAKDVRDRTLRLERESLVSNSDLDARE